MEPKTNEIKGSLNTFWTREQNTLRLEEIEYKKYKHSCQRQAKFCIAFYIECDINNRVSATVQQSTLYIANEHITYMCMHMHM